MLRHLIVCTLIALTGCDDSDFSLGDARDDTREDTREPRDLSALLDSSKSKDTEEQDIDTAPPDLEDAPHVTIITHDVDPDLLDTSGGQDTQTPADTQTGQDTRPGDTQVAQDTQPPPDTSPTDTNPPDTWTPPPTPNRGVYTYQKLLIGGLDKAVEVAFHPDSSYFIVLEAYDEIHVYDVASKAVTRFDLNPGGGNNFYFEAITFSPSGDAAWITGYHTSSSGEVGAMVRFDDASWRSYTPGNPASDVITPVANLPAGLNAIAGIAYPWDSGLPMVLGRIKPSSGYFMRLYRFDPVAESFTQTADAFTSAGCQDLAWANNEFGDPGVLVVCGINGFDARYWTEIGGVSEVRDARTLGNSNLGNTSRLAAYRGGEYALIVSNSGRALYRFEAGQLNGYSDAPRFSTLGIWGITFAPDGARALIVGRSSVNGTGTVIEFRHDLYSCPSPFSNCELTDVAVPGFFSPPYNATSNTYLQGAAFKPDCEGGIVVGGESSWQGSTGQVIAFQIQGGAGCGW